MLNCALQSVLPSTYQIISNRGRVTMGAMGAAAPTLFSEGLFCTLRNPLRSMNVQEFHCKFMEFDFLYPQLSISYLINDFRLQSICPSVRTSHFHIFQFLQLYHIMSQMKVAWHVLRVKKCILGHPQTATLGSMRQGEPKLCMLICTDFIVSSPLQST